MLVQHSQGVHVARAGVKVDDILGRPKGSRRDCCKKLHGQGQSSSRNHGDGHRWGMQQEMPQACVGIVFKSSRVVVVVVVRGGGAGMFAGVGLGTERVRQPPPVWSKNLIGCITNHHGTAVQGD